MYLSGFKDSFCRVVIKRQGGQRKKMQGSPWIMPTAFSPYPAMAHRIKEKDFYPMQNSTPRLSFAYLLENTNPRAMAWVRGGAEAPELSGLVKFYETPYRGVLVEAEIFGLPNINIQNSSDFYAMHIHDGSGCQNNFAQINGHFNPAGQAHPQHAGDLIPLLGNQGYAWAAFYDTRFDIKEIIGKYVIIHGHPDDFTTQPSGNSGAMIACGEIRPA